MDKSFLGNRVPVLLTVPLKTPNFNNDPFSGKGMRGMIRMREDLERVIGKVCSVPYTPSNEILDISPSRTEQQQAAALLAYPKKKRILRVRYVQEDNFDHKALGSTFERFIDNRKHVVCTKITAEVKAPFRYANRMNKKSATLYIIQDLSTIEGYDSFRSSFGEESAGPSTRMKRDFLRNSQFFKRLKNTIKDQSRKEKVDLGRISFKTSIYDENSDTVGWFAPASGTMVFIHYPNCLEMALSLGIAHIPQENVQLRVPSLVKILEERIRQSDNNQEKSFEPITPSAREEIKPSYTDPHVGVRHPTRG